MNWKWITPRLLVITGIILFAALMRLVPHYPNFTPIAAVALFGGAHFGKRMHAFMIPFIALLISDLFLGFHNLMIPVYLSFILVVLLGRLMRNNIKIPFVIGGSLAGSTLFFLVTNAAVWITSPMYPNTFQGLMASYTMAIPFYHAGLLGDLFYNTVLFGSFYFLQQWVPALKPALK